MPSKYDRILPRLPVAPVEKTPYQERVEQFKATVNPADPASLARGYARLRAEKTRLEEIEYALNLRICAYEQLLAESYEGGAEGWGQYGKAHDTLVLPTGEKVKVQKEPYGRVVDKEAFRLWCIANGYERQLQLWPSTMNALVKERLMAGDPEPDGTEALSRSVVKFYGVKPEKTTGEP